MTSILVPGPSPSYQVFKILVAESFESRLKELLFKRESAGNPASCFEVKMVRNLLDLEKALEDRWDVVLTGQNIAGYDFPFVEVNLLETAFRLKKLRAVVSWTTREKEGKEFVEFFLKKGHPAALIPWYYSGRPKHFRVPVERTH